MRVRLNNAIISEADYKTIIGELRAYHKFVLQSTIQQKLKTKSMPEIELTPVTNQLLVDQNFNLHPSARDIELLINQLEDDLLVLPRVRITLAALPSVKLKRMLCDWFRAEINPELLVDFRFNSALLGGVVIQIGSHIYDWSFRDRIINNRELLLKELADV